MEDVIVIGAGPAGLALGACLKANGITPLIVEREGTVGSAWRRHYDRLALHTDKKRSHLPMMAFAKSLPRYVPRADVVTYLEGYARHFDLQPRLGAVVQTVTPVAGHWRVTLAGDESLDARAVIFATGVSETPHYATWPGLESFTGPVLHSRAYRTPSDLQGQRVLVVGFGNSGGELAIDLVDAGRSVDIAVRGRVNLLPKELFGIPVGNFEILQKIFPYRIADMLTAPILRIMLGDYAQYGLRKASKGPIAQVKEDGRIPLIDLGTLALIKAGKIVVRTGLDHIEGSTVTFTNGQMADYDAILMATGYSVDLRSLLPESAEALDATGRPRRSGAALRSGLWFCSYHTVPNGQLRQIGIEAQQIAQEVALHLG